MEEILIIREEDFWEKEEALQHIAEALFFPADYGMNLGFRTPPDPEAYYNGLLGVKIIPYSLK